MTNAHTVALLALFVTYSDPVELWAQTCQRRLDLLGDADGFGLGLQPGDIVPVSRGFFNNQQPHDPFFTDTMPSVFPLTPRLSFTHAFQPPVGSFGRVQLRFVTMGIQDGDSQVLGSDTDIRLFLDDVEVPGAFDQVDQFDFFPGIGFAQTVDLVVIEVPANLHYVFQDGTVEVRLEVLQLGSSPGIDAFAIDFSELVAEGTSLLTFAARVDINVRDLSLVDDEFDLRTVFTVDPQDGDIDIGTDDVTVQIATTLLNIPGGSFDSAGRFEGVIADVPLTAELRKVAETKFEFRARGFGTNLGAEVNPVGVRLAIGGHCGETQVLADFEGRRQ